METAACTNLASCKASASNMNVGEGFGGSEGRLSQAACKGKLATINTYKVIT